MQTVIFSEYVDKLEHIIYAKYKNDGTKENEYTGRTKMEKKPRPFLNVHSPLVFKQHFIISEWRSATFILDAFAQFGRNLGQKRHGVEQ